MNMRLFSILWLVLASIPTMAMSARLDSVTTEYSEIEIFAEQDTLTPGETTWFAIRINVRPQWHVFWVNPGDAGLPLMTDWQLPDGFEAGEILHPTPKYIPVGPLASFAHETAPVFLVPVTVPDDAATGVNVTADIEANWQTCEEICVPENASLSFSLPITPQSGDAINETFFAQARARLPQIYDGAVTIQRVGSGLKLSLADWGDRETENVFFFPEQEGLTTPAAAQDAELTGGELVISAETGWTDLPETGPIKGIVSHGDFIGYLVSAQMLPATASVSGGAPPASNIAMLVLLAFLGGMILNAMPCVFPILFVKAASLAQAAHSEQKIARAHGLFYGAGVIATFMALAIVLLILRAGGEQIGWGFHLQSPVIVAISAYILFAVGLNLAGVFNVGESFANVGNVSAGRHGAGGAFATGALAVLVAAPCVGPLLTAPIGAALTQSTTVSLLIFLALAVGLAIPFVAVAWFPAIRRLLPKPGSWMVVFKQALSFPVFAAAAFFVWVYLQQTDAGAHGGLLAGLVLLALSAWLFQVSKGDDNRALVVRAGSAIALLAAAVPLVTASPAENKRGDPMTGAYGAIVAEPFSPARLGELRADNKSVFIDFTAAWCITCQVNKITVLRSQEIAETFAATDTTLLVADWTLRDPVITDALSEFGAAGVPLYVVYRDGAEPVILPQTLTKNTVIEALRGS